MKSNILKDKKLKKSLTNLKYLAIFMIIAVVALGFIYFTYIAWESYTKSYKGDKTLLYWIPIIYFVGFLIIYGILDVLKIINNLGNGNIFTFENANLLKNIDRKLVINFLFSLIVNIIMVLLNLHYFGFLAIWIIFISFLLIGHVLVASLAILVEKSAEMRLEMDLTI